MRKLSLPFITRVAVAGLEVLSLLLSYPAFAVNQNAYRWRNDDGTETTATWAASENAAPTVYRGDRERLRFSLQHQASDGDVAQSLRLNAGDDAYYASAFDPATSFLYVGTGESPARILRFDTTSGPPFSAPSVITLAAGENNIFVSAIDTANGFAYFVTSTVPSKVIKVQLSTFTRVATLTLSTGDDYVSGGTLSNGYLYLTTRTNPGGLVKVRLSDFTRQARIATSTDDLTYSFYSPVAAGTKLYLADGNPNVLRFDISNPGTTDPSFVDSLAIPTPGSPYNTASYTYVAGLAVDPANGFLYAANYYGLLHKIDVSGGTTFSYVGYLALGISALNGTFTLDQAHGKLYVSSYNADVSKVDLGTFTQDAATTSLLYGNQYSYQLSADGSKVFAPTYTVPAHILEIDVASIASSYTGTSVYSGASGGDSYASTSVIDTATNKEYIGTCKYGTDGDYIVQVDLSTMTRTGRIDLPSGYSCLYVSAIDETARYAYFVDYNAPSHLIRVHLDSFPAYDVLTLPADGPYYYHYDGMTIDTNPAHHYLYLGSYGVPSAITQVDLNTFTRGSSISLSSSPMEDRLDNALVLDTTHNKLYAGAGSAAGYIVRIDVAGSNLSRDTSIPTTGDTFANGMAIDQSAGYLYMSTSSTHILKVDVTGGTTLAIVDSLYVGGAADYVYNAAIDTTDGVLYFASYATPGKVFRVETSPFAYDPSDDIVAPSGEEYVATVATYPAGGYFTYATVEAPILLVKTSVNPKKRLRIEYAPKVTTCAAASYAPVAGGAAWAPSISPNVDDSTATTDATGVTDPSGAFKPGYFMSAYAQAPGIRLLSNEFTEVEYSLKSASTATPGAYCFRLTDAGTPLASYATYAEATLKTNDPTISNAITLGRNKVGVSTTVAISFTLQNTLSGPLTVTFPAGFTVTAAASSGSSSSCLSGFGFTGSTLTATKTGCSGTIVLAGATVTNPAAPGVYTISWVNDDPGSGQVVVVTDDQTLVTASIDPSITFNAGAQASATACDGTFSGNGGALALGTVSTGAVASSDVASVPHICTRVSTNAASGAVVTVRSSNASLKSTSTPTDTVPSSTATVTAGTADYGLCAGSGGSDSGKDTTAPAGAVPAAAAPFNGACSSVAHAVGGLTTASQNLWAISAAAQNAFFRLYVKAAVSGGTVGHTDYGDTLIFVATGTY